MKPASEDNQAEVRTRGHIDVPLDPHLSTSDGLHIGLTTNFGVTHHGFVSESDGTQQTK